MAISAVERQRAYRKRNPKRSCASWQRYASSTKGIVTTLLNYARDRAKKDGLPFDIDREWLASKVEAGVCELTGLPVERPEAGPHRAHPFTPRLDRKVPSLGYVKSNCRLVCFAANMAMCDWGDEVLLKIARALVERHPA